VFESQRRTCSKRDGQDTITQSDFEPKRDVFETARSISGIKPFDVALFSVGTAPVCSEI
jgi:hypothetical protein